MSKLPSPAVVGTLGAHPAPPFVVHRRRPALVLGPEVGEIYQPAFGTVHQAVHARVVGVVDLELLARQALPALAAGEQAGEMDAVSAGGPFADHQSMARGAAGLVDQGSRGWSAGVVDSGLVQRREDALEGIVRVHGALFPRSALRSARGTRIGPATPVICPPRYCRSVSKWSFAARRRPLRSRP